MIYPSFMKKGDVIGVVAPSNGIVKDDDVKKLILAKENFKSLGFGVLEAKSVRKSFLGRSASAEVRAKELEQCFSNKDIKSIICATGGRVFK